jgi:hypothetical protein
MIGRVRFQNKGVHADAVLDDEVKWICPSAPYLAAALNKLLVRRLLRGSPDDNDPLAAAIEEAAALLHGTYELEPRKLMPEESAYPRR